jgi:hypothetical protein
VLGERYQPDAVIFDVRAHPAVLERLRGEDCDLATPGSARLRLRA